MRSHVRMGCDLLDRVRQSRAGRTPLSPPPRGRDARRRPPGAGAPPRPAARRPHPRPRVRHRQLPLRDARPLQASGDRSAGAAFRARIQTDRSRAEGLPRDAGAIPRNRGQALGERDRGAGALDRLSSVAGPPARRRPDRARTGAHRLWEHRMAGCGAGL